MQKSYLAKITFDEDAKDYQGSNIPLRWPDGSKFPLSTLDGSLNEGNELVWELLWRALGGSGIGVEVLNEINT